MNRRKILMLSGGVSLALMVGAQNLLFTACSTKVKPNIVFIFVDDLSWADVGC